MTRPATIQTDPARPAARTLEVAIPMIRTLPLLLALSSATPAFGDAALTKVEVSPPEINLATARDRQSVVVQATFADGITRDVTAEASLTPADASLVRRDGSTFHPLKDGKTTLAVAFGGASVTVPV